VSAFFTALGGALIALLIRGAYPDMLYWTVGGDIMLICLIGGIKVFLGPVVGAVVFEILDGIINRFTVYWPLVLGIILILVLIFFREGITGLTYRPYRKTVTGLNDDNA
jgi:branched-chain amino acid transport system permease protein